jgi:hypothetical protein
LPETAAQDDRSGTLQPVSQTQTTPDTRSRSPRRAWLAPVAVAAALIVGAFFWSAPREDVAAPGPGATPEQVVRAYIDAVNARDFDTANTIDARQGEDLGRFSQPMEAHDVEMGDTVTVGSEAHVIFTADFGAGDGTVEDGPWGYYLERGGDGLWRITDAGVS